MADRRSKKRSAVSRVDLMLDEVGASILDALVAKSGTNKTAVIVGLIKGAGGCDGEVEDEGKGGAGADDQDGR